MTDKRFNIVVSAVDHTTAAIRKINASFMTLVRPVAHVQAATRAFSKESGLDRIGKSFVDMGRAAGDAAEKVSGVATPLAAITSFGSVAGMAALALKWSQFGTELLHTSEVSGVALGRLQSLRGAASIAGLSADALSEGLKNLGTTMQDALYGRNQQALGLMNRLGVAMHRTKDGAVDAARAFYDISDAIKRQKNPQVQALIARTFGLEESLPLLRQGSKAVKEFEEAWKKTGAVMTPEQVETADRLRMSIALLGGTLVGVANQIALNLAKMGPWVDWLSHLISSHQQLVAVVAEVGSGLLALRLLVIPFLSVFGTLATVLRVTVLPILSLLASGFIEVGVAIMATPIGWIVGGMALIAAGAYEIYKHWDAITAAIQSAASGVARFLGLSSGSGVVPRAPATSGAGPTAGSAPSPVVAGGPAATPFLGGLAGGVAGAATALVTIAFENLPRGARVRTESGPGVAVDSRINYALPSGVTP